MQFSIKSPNAFLWKTGYTEAKIISSLNDGQISGDWLVCLHGDAAEAFTINEFVNNPKIFKKSYDESKELNSHRTNVSQSHLSIAALGWWVFFGALAAHFLLASILSNYGGEITRNNSSGAIFVATLLKGIEALVIAGGITALLGHAYKILKKEQPANELETK